jgi:hypothetical protein
MSLYARDDERAIRVQRLVNDWTRSGLLIAEQKARILPELQVNLRRTNFFLRATLFVFGYMIVNALTGLFVVTLNLSEGATMYLAGFAAIGFFAVAQVFVRQLRLYRFGIEEAAAVASVSFLAIAASMLWHPTFSMLQATIAAAAGSFIVFRRFGYVYAGVAATIFVALIPFATQQVDTVRRLAAMAIMTVVFFIARERRQDHDWDYPGDAYAVIEAVAWGALYLVANLKASSWLASPDDVGAFYWATYAAIWILPAAGLFMAIRGRHRLLLDANIVLALITMMSNKPYLGAAQKPWDPILFGVLLITVAIGVRRWLASGEKGTRFGFVAHRLLASEKERLAMAGSATVLAPGAPPSHTPEPASSIGGGGRSGGAGAAGTF